MIVIKYNHNKTKKIWQEVRVLKTELHPSGCMIAFEEKWHKYSVVNKPGITFTSGTKFLKQFFQEFDKENISKRYAAKHNLSQKEVLDMWARKGTVSREAGTLTHAYLEGLALGKDMNIQECAYHVDEEIAELALSKIRTAEVMFEQLVKEYEILKAEMIVASLKENIAGQVDLLARHKASGRLAFLDYKTNAEIKFENIFQNGLGCLEHLQDTNYNHYCLQLGLYEYIAETEGYLDEYIAEHGDWPYVERQIIHIRSDGYSFIPCQDVSVEINNMLESVRGGA
jgi:hypothetical protein